MVSGFFALLQRHGAALLAIGLLVGLVVPPLAALLRPALPVLVFLLTGATFLAVDWPGTAAHARRPALMIFIPAWTLVASPVLAVLAARLVGLPASLIQGLVLWAASAPLAAGPALAMLLGLDGALALLAMVIGTLLMPLTLPPLALGLIGLDIGIGVAPLMVRLALFVGGAAALAILLRRLAGAARLQAYETEIAGFNVLLLHLFAIAVMDGVGDLILAAPASALLYVLTAFAANLGLQAAGLMVAWRLGRVPALTIGLISGNRNMAVVMANLGSAASPEIALFFAAVQFPIYTLPAILGPLYRRWREGA